LLGAPVLRGACVVLWWTFILFRTWNFWLDGPILESAEVSTPK